MNVKDNVKQIESESKKIEDKERDKKEKERNREEEKNKSIKENKTRKAEKGKRRMKKIEMRKQTISYVCVACVHEEINRKEYNQECKSNANAGYSISYLYYLVYLPRYYSHSQEYGVNSIYHFERTKN